MSNIVDLGIIPCNDIFKTGLNGHPGSTIEHSEIMEILKNITNKNCPINIITLKNMVNNIKSDSLILEKNIKNINKMNITNISLLSLFNIFLLIIIFKL
jgi:hypothetical protein